ncbi:uncharacterized protein LOC118647819 [Monomorium pharaonis]|uniref:uncharacterized protein LOC118647597 n=2 Tax=Monomorium pharaonis TaxID=307658 RepID=UPI0017473704|nr:uncharacterized protein LOC118647597 [Monomorium pharaonis]XP_036148839.1 uncharacterized protein LOC105828399 [Monomorium pharaonis]XP_036149190.1 uncharacterized protein LOC118647786 [Monomorium pharaonis]XP_036149312.1 uncharacterized protein LOC118647819 [Monomorium pharaonis]
MDQQKRINRKGSRSILGRASRPKKRPTPPNRHSFGETSSSAKKLKHSDEEVPISATHGYRIISFVAIFSSLSEMLKCKTCNGNINFSESNICGLGFKLVVNCDNCEPRYINSCPLIKNAYEINRRIVFVMRLLGIGYDGVKKFCGLMDISKMFTKNVYYDILENIHIASKAVTSILFSEAACEEKLLTAQAENTSELAGLYVSGDGTWRKRGFSSLQGVVSLIGIHSGKVLDIIVKSLYCKGCEYGKKIENTQEFETWEESHKDTCSITHEGNAGKMEVDGAVEMFARSEELHGVKYTSYIGDGDCKTYKGIVESRPYGDDVLINKKECVGHVQKRMGARLRKVKKDTKGLGGKGKLTAKLIDELSVYYGLAIRRHKDSKEEMKTAIWATLKHKCSTDNNPQHDNCPPGPNSWCTWQVAKANNKLTEYVHKPALHQDVIKAITPIYEELSRDDLLERCVGGYTQNNNESLNGLIWSFAPKKLFSGLKTVEIATNIAASIFNKGYASIILMMNIMHITIGPITNSICETLDERRISIAEARMLQMSKESRTARRQERMSIQDSLCEKKNLYYEAGMAD